MKKFHQFAMVALALSALTFGCRPEGVGPEGQNRQAPTLKAAEGDPIPPLDPICGDAKTYVLVSQDGSEIVNRCFGPASEGYPQVACSGNMPAWGSVTVMNGLTDFVANICLAPDWVGSGEWVRTALPSAFAIGNDGFPVVDNSWSYRAINPIVGKWPVARTLNTTGNFFGLGMKLTVVQLTPMGDVVPNSTTTLWLREANPVATPGSPYVAEWTRNHCGSLPSTQTICTVIHLGAPALTGCTTLAPTITNPVGTVTYAWSTGATTATINVCPTANTSYTVQVSDGSGPRAVYQYNVKLQDVSCTQGNGNGNGNQNRVYLCHIPPGNPSNANEVCSPWNSVRNHIPGYRTNNSNQDHNSGCYLGRCGTNPCN